MDIHTILALLAEQGPTVRELINKYLHARELDAKGGLIGLESLRHLHDYLGRFAARFGERKAMSIRPHDLKDFILSHAGWRSDHTRQDAARSVIKLFRWAEAEDLILKNPIRNFKKCWNTPQPRQAIRPEEVAAILNRPWSVDFKKYSRTAFRVGIFFLWGTGARTCEMREARWQNVDWEQSVIRMPSKSTHVTGQLRIIPLPPVIIRLLRFVWLRRSRRLGSPPQPTDHIFLNGRGRAWSKKTFGSLFRKHADAAGVRRDVSAYCLRHGFCVQSLEAGIGERQIADCLGHSSTDYVSWYGKSTRQNGKYLRNILEQLQQHRDKQKGNDDGTTAERAGNH